MARTKTNTKPLSFLEKLTNQTIQIYSSTTSVLTLCLTTNILSKECKWNSHITSMVNKAWARLGCLRSFKYTRNKSCLETLYIMFVRPLLEYGDVVWDNCTEQQKSDIEAVQIDAARILTGATNYCNTASLYAELNMQPLTDRRKQHKLTLLFKMKRSTKLHLQPYS